MDAGSEAGPAGISTAKDAADHELVLAFGRLQEAANRLEYVLGRRSSRSAGSVT